MINKISILKCVFLFIPELVKELIYSIQNYLTTQKRVKACKHNFNDFYSYNEKLYHSNSIS